MAYRILSPGQEEDLGVWLQRMLEEYERYLEEKFRVPVYTAAPINPFEGMIVIADGTSWNPGSGRGYYGYTDGSWTFLG